MYGFSVLFFIFGFLIFLAGLYIYTGHKSELLLWKTHNVEKLTLKELKHIGKWTMISSIIPIILAILGLIFKW